LEGKKSTAYGVFYGAIDIVGQKVKSEEKSPLEVWKQALENITPQVEVKSRRVGGATFQVPMEIRPDRKISISMKNLILLRKKTFRKFNE
jgi:small subunit ribosomal protein S7